jgi:hypothetical protein
LKIDWAFSASFQKSGWEVIWVNSSMRFCLPSTSKTPPQKIEALFEAGQLFGGFFQHLESLFCIAVILNQRATAGRLYNLSPACLAHSSKGLYLD